MRCYCYLIFPSNDGKKMEKYRPSVSQKNVNAAPQKKYFKTRGPWATLLTRENSSVQLTHMAIS